MDRFMMSNISRFMMSSVGWLMMRSMGRLVDNILAAAVVGVHIAPLGSCMVHTLAITLDTPTRVYEGQAGALAPNVGVGGGSLLHCLGAGHGQEEGGEDDG